MSFTRPFIIIMTLLLLAAPLRAGQESVDSPQALYLQAGKEERSGSLVKAREIYESIVDRFPESDFAVKANDRLLLLPGVKQKSDREPTSLLSTVFTSSPPKALPADPLLRRGVETARIKAKAESVRRQELERQKELHSAREGRKASRRVLAEKEANWQKAADQKIIDEFGMSLDELGEKLKQVCSEAKVKGDCSEEAFYLLSSTP